MERTRWMKWEKTEKHGGKKVAKKKQPKVAKSNQGIFEQEILNLPNLPRKPVKLTKLRKKIVVNLPNKIWGLQCVHIICNYSTMPMICLQPMVIII